MLTEDYLNLRLVRLKAAEQWQREGEGVCFLFPRGGAGQYTKGAARQPLCAGDILIVNGEPTAAVSSIKNSEFAFWGFSLRLEHLLPLFGCAEISLLRSVLDKFKGYKFYPKSSPLAAECHNLIAGISPQFNLDHRGQLLRVAAAILSEEFKTAHGERVGFVRAEDHLVQVFEKLSADEMLSLSVDELADRFGCSRRHLNRLFHQYFGFSVAALRMEMRLMKAVSLLRDCDAKVINVAEQCGFNHLGLFNTCFRRRFGTSPGQWRKTAAENGEKPPKSNGDNSECPLRTKGLCPWPASTALVNHAAASIASGGVRSIPQEKRKPGSKLQRMPSPPGFAVTVAAALKVDLALPFQVRAQQ